MELPVCKIKVLLIIPGFNTKAVEIDLVGNKAKYKNPIRITVKREGQAKIDW
jgi:hypothetical protein